MATEVQRGIHTRSALVSTSDVEKWSGPMLKVKIQNRHGLHARPAAAIVRSLELFASEVCITFRRKTANARSVLGLLMLGVPCGSSITVRAAGEDAQKAVEAIQELVQKQFYEGGYDTFH